MANNYFCVWTNKIQPPLRSVWVLGRLFAYPTLLIKYYLSLGGIGTGHLPADVVDGVVGVVGSREYELRHRHQGVAIFNRASMMPGRASGVWRAALWKRMIPVFPHNFGNKPLDFRTSFNSCWFVIVIILRKIFLLFKGELVYHSQLNSKILIRFFEISLWQYFLISRSIFLFMTLLFGPPSSK